MAVVIEPTIDSRLAQLWFWPFSSTGADLRLGATPAAIKSIANLLVAAAIEANKTSFAGGVAASAEGGEAMQIPYGTTLQRMGEARLKAVAEGTADIAELERRTPCRVSRATKAIRPPVRRLW